MDLFLQQNHVVERIWVRVNQRVNFPIKAALVNMVDQEILDMDDELTKYCTSSFTCQISSIGMQRAVDAWNAHRIPGTGNVITKPNGCKHATRLYYCTLFSISIHSR